MSRLDRLLNAVADRPPGEKVNIPALIRAFTPTQAETVAAIEHLIAIGRLDAKTLRRPALETQTTARSKTPEPTEPPAPKAVAEEGGDARKVAPPSTPSGLELMARLQAFIAEHDLSRTLVAQHLFNSSGGISLLRFTKRPKPKTVEKVSAFLSSPPLPKLKKQPQPTVRSSTLAIAEEELAALPAAVVAELSKPAQEQVAWAKRKGTPTMAERASRFEERRAKQNTRGASGTARKASSAEESTLAEEETSSVRIEDRAPPKEPASTAVPAHPSVDIKVNKPRKPKPPRRDPTQPPETPLMDMRDKQVLKGFRHAAAVNRGHEQNATQLVDAGVDPGTQSTVTANVMRRIIARRVEEKRASDPIEQAKTLLRRRYSPVCNADVAGGPKGKFIVGRLLVTQTELLAMAERLVA